MRVYMRARVSVRFCALVRAHPLIFVRLCVRAYTRDRETESKRVSVVSVYARIYVFSLESVGGCYCCYCCFCLYYRLSALLVFVCSLARSSFRLRLISNIHANRVENTEMKLGQIFNLESRFSLALFNTPDFYPSSAATAAFF